MSSLGLTASSNMEVNDTPNPPAEKERFPCSVRHTRFLISVTLPSVNLDANFHSQLPLKKRLALLFEETMDFAYEKAGQSSEIAFMLTLKHPQLREGIFFDRKNREYLNGTKIMEKMSGRKVSVDQPFSMEFHFVPCLSKEKIARINNRAA